MTRALFVVEQHLGHRTYYENLRRFVDENPHLVASWAPVTYNQPAGLIERLPGLPMSIQGTLRGRAEVRRALSMADCDVVFFNTQVPGALGGGLTRKRPYVIATDITPRQYDDLGAQYNHAADRPGPLATYKHMVNTRLLRNAAYLLPWSSWTRDSLIHDYGVAADRIEVIPPGVDLEYWPPRSMHADRSDPLRILFVGGDLHRKGGDTLLRAFRDLPSGFAELHLVTRTRIAPEAGVHTYYDLQPNEPRLVQLFQSSDVFALPTTAEAFGIAAAEASASGLAVVATAVGGLTDIVVDGETGFLVDPGNSAAMTARLKLLADDPDLCVKMGRAARIRAEIHFDARRNTARIADVLVQIARGVPIQYNATAS
jgi:glycosyltransferase involved in cell wall biosynthesis